MARLATVAAIEDLHFASPQRAGAHDDVGDAIEIDIRRRHAGAVEVSPVIERDRFDFAKSRRADDDGSGTSKLEDAHGGARIAARVPTPDDHFSDTVAG